MVNNINRGSGFPIRREFVLRFALMKILGKNAPRKSFEPQVFSSFSNSNDFYKTAYIYYKDREIKLKVSFRNQRKEIMSQTGPSSERKI